MGGERIKLDLSDFLENIGCHRWMFLCDNKFVTVGDLVDKLKKEYSQLEKDTMVQVFMGGEFLIPHLEPIQILQSGDLVRVVKSQRKRWVRRKLEDKPTKPEKVKKLGKEQNRISTQNKKHERRLGILNKTDSHIIVKEPSRGSWGIRKSRPENQMVLKTYNEVQGVNNPKGVLPQRQKVLKTKEMRKNIRLIVSQSSLVNDDSNPSSSYSVFNPSTGQVDVYSNRSVVLENKDYSAYPAVGDREPRVGEIIAFRVVELGEDYAPGVSEYKEGKVMELDYESVKFQLVNKGYNIKIGQFEIDDHNVEEIFTCKWMQLIDAKLLSF